MVFSLIRALALWVSILGFCFALHRKGVHMAFTPAITLTGIGSAMFLAGILNMLPHMLFLLFTGGIMAFLKEKPWKFFRKNFAAWLPLLVFTGLCLFFFWRTREQYPVIYDAFSHWMTVVRNTVKTDAFPNFTSELISFQSYPTGTAGFAYYVCKIVGVYADDFVLFAQSMLYAACLCSTMAFVKKWDLASGAITGFCWIYCLIACPIDTVSLCEPLPDTLISILAIASLAILVYYRADLKKAICLSLPIQIFLVAVKNSGMFLMIFNSLLLLYYVWQRCREQKALCRRECLKAAAIHCGIPVLVFFLWSRHVDYVFLSAEYSKHAMSLNNYRGTLGAKSFDQIFEILRLYLTRFFSWGDSWLLLIVAAALFTAAYLIRKKHLHQSGTDAIHTFAGIVITYTLYMVGLAGMYLVSMDYNEAVGIGSYARYEMTILIYLVGAICIYLLELTAQLPRDAKQASYKGAAVLFAAILLATQADRISMLAVKDNLYQGSTRQLLEEVKAEYGIPDGTCCMVYGSQVTSDWGYHGNMSKYIFWHPQAQAYSPEMELPDFESACQVYDYLILMDTDEAMDAYLTANGLPPGQRVYRLAQ